jgi:hypothetical protein
MSTPTRNPRPVTIDQQEPIFDIGRMALDLDGDTLRYLLLRGWQMWRDNRTNFELRNYQMCENGYIYATREPRTGISDRQWIGTGVDMLLIHIEDAKKFNPRGYTDAMLGDEREVTVPLKSPLRFEFDPKTNTIIDRKYTPPQKGSDVFMPLTASFKHKEGSTFEPQKELTEPELEAFKLKLPVGNKTRKEAPLADGLLDYFPDALYDVARLSQIGNDQHNPGQPLHWARGKSSDHRNTILRHSLQAGQLDGKVLHDTKVAWRALAQLQITIERMRSKGIQYPPDGE